ncbi:hypothetical protein BdWA1_003289 [Babesia duncani]|uniref:Uncharacterized protein n=1 Tax=Babesia duncani TaxID=323732 RepID=A0AAD9UNA6_9APIC|nr:hypothetical protein BdWA1_003289 [Babesia duncani]
MNFKLFFMIKWLFVGLTVGVFSSVLDFSNVEENQEKSSTQEITETNIGEEAGRLNDVFTIPEFFDKVCWIHMAGMYRINFC